MTVDVVTVGRKGRDFMRRAGSDDRRGLHGISATARRSATSTPIARLVIDDFISGDVDAVDVVYSTLHQHADASGPTCDQLLPDRAAGGATQQRQTDEYIFEPTPRRSCSELLPRYVEIAVYQAILENIASRAFSAQMVAMRNATDNANDLINDLTSLQQGASGHDHPRDVEIAVRRARPLG